ncbi:hypothetical protein DICVIV_00590 [Dictyocaulus viviparus]|uniref:ZP domain-containing protein n=1 Tax=Dictyocaulus viviparus TaxID=29172 RepID=A0A0D8YB91_DICVI|nr:hypothetical protein DICVIV_00590 [Dictyocaulus viviparus]
MRVILFIQTDFLLRIKFNETFTGLIQTEKGDPNCVYVNASIQQSIDYEVKRFAGYGIIWRYNNRKFCYNNSFFISKYLKTISISYKFFIRFDLQKDVTTYTVHLGPSIHGRIGRCWASDGRSDLDLSDNNGCSLQRAGEVWGDFEVLRDDYGTTFISRIKAWAFPTSNEVNIFCNLHVCKDCTQYVCRPRSRRGPTVVTDVTNTRARDDDVPPIPVRASFQLRRDANQTTPLPNTRPPEAASAATIGGRVFASVLCFTFTTMMML